MKQQIVKTASDKKIVILTDEVINNTKKHPISPIM